LPRVMKECFGTVISSLKKMKECVRCELLRECRAINWDENSAEPPAVVRRPTGTDDQTAIRGEDR
jgi:hypothetical protein